MAKQEDIREVIDTYTDDVCLYPDKDCKNRGSDRVGKYCVSMDGSYKCLMERLDKIGVVIKVRHGGEMPMGHTKHLVSWLTYESLIEEKP